MIITAQQAKRINIAILIGGAASGLLSDDIVLFYKGFKDVFVLLVMTVIPVAMLVYHYCLTVGDRIQIHDPRRLKLLKEIWVTIQCLWTVSAMVAWPLKRYRQGRLHSYVWDMEESTPGSRIIGNAIYVLLTFLFVDFYTYWKHRLLHTNMFFAFHADHHQFHDPTSFGAFAVSPMEAVLTFGLVLFHCLPQADLIKFYFPLHMGVIVSFVALTLYLHAGHTLTLLEVTLPRLFVNTSAFHNRHHFIGTTHFGELLTLWDYIMNTGHTFYNPYAPKVRD